MRNDFRRAILIIFIFAIICCINKISINFVLLHCESSSVGRAQPSQGWGRGFEPRFSLNITIRLYYKQLNQLTAIKPHPFIVNFS